MSRFDLWRVCACDKSHTLMRRRARVGARPSVRPSVRPPARPPARLLDR